MVHTVTSGGRFLEICHPMAQKSYGLAQLAEHLGIRQDEIIAIGDNNNDLDMLRYAGLGVAVDNAVQAAKEAADRLTASNNDDGVARLIQEIIL
jgi:hydroxymethylpyrimidine pyrophosphatase-like HAD family hydrolase